MHNVIGVNLFLRKFLRMETDNSVPTPLLNGGLPGARAVTCGVPQGSLSGPLFFLIYINRLPDCLTKDIPRWIYADDTSSCFAASSLPEL